MELADDALSLAKILRANGYATHAVGKWHLARDTNLAPGRTRDSWPLQRGFDSYYGSLEGLNSFYYPNELISDNSVVDVEEYPSDYYVTDDITDKAISRIKSLRAHDADKPFFLYFSHIAMHGPHQAKPEGLAKYRGRYTEGWDAVRRSRFDAQLEAGFFPPGTQMTERNTEPGYDAPPWDELTEEEQLRFARYQEVYAAMVDSIDQSVGRVLDTLDELGETDNTIIVFTSDNGGTAEGGAAGTRSYFSQFVHGPVPSDWVRDVPHDEELIGSEKIGLLSWPAGLGCADGDTGLRKHYAYVTDITPTLLDLAGLETPSHRNGLPAQERDGVSIADILRDAAQPTPHTEQYAEFGGHRGFYRDGWKLLSLHGSDPGRRSAVATVRRRIRPGRDHGRRASLPREGARTRRGVGSGGVAQHRVPDPQRPQGRAAATGRASPRGAGEDPRGHADTGTLSVQCADSVPRLHHRRRHPPDRRRRRRSPCRPR